jgi:hypothetical protein
LSWSARFKSPINQQLQKLILDQLEGQRQYCPLKRLNIRRSIELVICISLLTASQASVYLPDAFSGTLSTLLMPLSISPLSAYNSAFVNKQTRFAGSKSLAIAIDRNAPSNPLLCTGAQALSLW